MSNIIFDFDGTIADTMGVVVEILHVLSGRTKPEDRVSPEVIARMQGMSLRQAAKEVNFPLWKTPYLFPKGLKMLRAQMGSIKAFPDMPETIQALHKEGYQLYIISSNSVSNIEPFLERHGMSGMFTQIYGNVGLFNKTAVLKRVMRQNKLDPTRTLYVGDEVRDVEGAKHAKVQVMAVTWGYNNAQILTSHHPDFIVNTPAEAMKIFKTF